MPDLLHLVRAAVAAQTPGMAVLGTLMSIDPATVALLNVIASALMTLATIGLLVATWRYARLTKMTYLATRRPVLFPTGFSPKGVDNDKFSFALRIANNSVVPANMVRWRLLAHVGDEECSDALSIRSCATPVPIAPFDDIEIHTSLDLDGKMAPYVSAVWECPEFDLTVEIELMDQDDRQHFQSSRFRYAHGQEREFALISHRTTPAASWRGLRRADASRRPTPRK